MVIILLPIQLVILAKKVLSTILHLQFSGFEQLIIKNQIVSIGYVRYFSSTLPFCRLIERLIQVIFVQTSSLPKSVNAGKGCFQGEIALS
jgi:hypothetical protein